MKSAIDEKLHGIIGMATRSRQIVIGEAMTIDSIRSKKAEIALVYSYASENAMKKISDACSYYNVPLAILSCDLLDSATGKEGRKAAAILRGGLAKQALKVLVQGDVNSSHMQCQYTQSTSQNAGVQSSNDQG